MVPTRSNVSIFSQFYFREADMIDSLSLLLHDEPSLMENEGFLVSNRTVSLFIYLSPLM